VVASLLTAGVQPFPGTDGKQHVVYELVLTNANATPARLQKIEVLDAEKPGLGDSIVESNDLQTHLRTTGSSAVENTDIEFNGTRIFLVDVAVDTGMDPNRLLHRLTVTGGSTPARTPGTPIEMTYTSAPLDRETDDDRIAACRKRMDSGQRLLHARRASCDQHASEWPDPFFTAFCHRLDADE
jgi:hypothetical protein